MANPSNVGRDAVNPADELLELKPSKGTGEMFRNLRGLKYLILEPTGVEALEVCGSAHPRA